MITIEELKSKIGYLANPWKFNPEQSFNNAVQWTVKLRNMGFYLFSPILHTHPFWVKLHWWQQDEQFGAASIIDKTVSNYLKNEDWITWDLRIIDGFAAHDGFEKLHGEGTYDSKLFMLMDKSAFTLKPVDHIMEIGMKNVYWHSQGCRQEYEKAKAEHIQIFELQAMLNGELKEL